MMTSSPKRLIALTTSLSLILGACQTSDAPVDIEPEVRPRAGAAPPPGLEAEVDQLRANGIAFGPTASVGAVRSVGSVDRMGNANLQIPIDLPAGPAGHSPELGLHYNSNQRGGNGNLGLGFSLTGFSSIRRCGKTLDVDGVTRPFEFLDGDALCLNGKRLGLEKGTVGQDGAVYRTLQDEFAKIVLHGDIDEVGSWFEVFHRDGTIDELGHLPATLWRALDVDDLVPYAWAIDTRRDRFGNEIEYAYLKPIVNGSVSELQPMAIRWAGIGDNATERRVEFYYEDRADKLEGYHSGVQFGHEKRLNQIRVVAPRNGVATTLFNWNLKYEGDQQGVASLTNRSRLVAVEKCSGGGVCFPATTIDWEVPEPSEAHLEPAWQPAPSQAIADSHARLASARQRLVGDFDGDLFEEVLFWNAHDYPGTGLVEFRTWLSDYEKDSWSPDCDTSPPAGWCPDEDETYTEFFASIEPLAPSPNPYAASLFVGAHTSGAPLQPMAMTATDDGITDILWPHPGPTDYDEHGVQYADGFDVLLGHGLDELLPTYVDDGTTQHIYQFAPTDYDGDGLTDVYLCRGDGYKSATWVLAHNAPGLAFTFHDTGVRCSAHDELHLLSLRGGPPSLLVVPAYDPGVAALPDPSKPDYTDALDAIPEAQRTEYLELVYEIGGVGTLEPSGLPRDVYQRLHDAGCWNGPKLDAGQPPSASAGFGNDKVADINNDGLPDVLRFELANGDTFANPDILEGLPDSVDVHGYPAWADPAIVFDPLFPSNPQEQEIADQIAYFDQYGYPAPVICEDEAQDPINGRVVLRLNTGAGFTAPIDVFSFDGGAHANYAMNFIGGVIDDVNMDGFGDLALPSGGVGNGDDEWRVKVGNGNATMLDMVGSIGLDWPAYRDDATDFKEQIEVFGQAALLRVRDLGEVPGWKLIQPYSLVDPVQSPYQGEGWVSLPVTTLGSHANVFTGLERVTRITDGVGAVETFSYLPDAQPITGTYQTGGAYPTVGPRFPHTVVSTHVQRGRPTTYDFSSAKVDRLGAGFLGYERVTATTAGRVTVQEFDFGRDPSVAGYPFAAAPVRTMEKVLVPSKEGGMDAHLVCTETELTIDTRGLLSGDVSYFAYPSTVVVDRGLVADEEAECDDLLAIDRYHRTTVAETRDAYGTVTSRVTEVAGGDTTTLTRTRITNLEPNWLIGLVGRETVESCTPSAECLTRTVEQSYDLTTGMRTTVVVEPNDAKLRTVASFVPDAFGNVEFASVFAGGQLRATTTDYDADGVYPTKITDPNGHVSYVVHDTASGVPYAQVSPEGLTFYTEFDQFFRPKRSEVRSSPTGPHDGNPVTTTYLPGVDPTGYSALRTLETSANGKALIEDRDVNDRLRRRAWLGMAPAGTYNLGEIPAGDWVFETYDYDLFGNKVQQSLPTYEPGPPDGHATWEYDDLDRVTRRLLPSGEQTLWSYDQFGGSPAGTRISETDADNHTTVSQLDTQGRVEHVEEPNGAWSCWTYRPFDNVATIERNCSASGGASGVAQPTTTYTYDTLGRVLTESDPAFGTRVRAYTSFGELHSYQDGNGTTTTYGYDSLSREVSRTSPDGVATTTWDTQRLGAVTSQTSEDGVQRDFTYDSFGRLRSETTTAVVAGESFAKTFAYTYGPGGRLELTKYPIVNGATQMRVRRYYDAAGYERTLVDDLTGQVLWQLDDADASSQITGEGFGNGTHTERKYDDLSRRPLSIETSHPLVGIVQDMTYQWGPDGELHSRTAQNGAGQTETFSYDELHRLEWSEVTNPSASQATDVDFDLLGNITYKTGVGNYSYDADGVLTAAGPTAVVHDGAGQIVTRGNQSLTWAANGKVRSITSAGNTLRMTYGPDGGRVVRHESDSGDSLLTLGDAFEVRIGPDARPQVVKQRVAAPSGRIVAQYEQVIGVGPPPVEVSYFHDDALGSTNARTDDVGAPTLLAYGPWGDARDASDWTLPFAGDPAEAEVGFTGHKARLDDGLIDMRGRMYDPNLARFMSPDPLVVSPLSVQGHNRYSYVDNRPMVFTDPTGFAKEGAADDDDGRVEVDLQAIVNLFQTVFEENSAYFTSIFYLYAISAAMSSDDPVTLVQDAAEWAVDRYKRHLTGWADVLSKYGLTLTEAAALTGMSAWESYMHLQEVGIVQWELEIALAKLENVGNLGVAVWKGSTQTGVLLSQGDFRKAAKTHAETAPAGWELFGIAYTLLRPKASSSSNVTKRPTYFRKQTIQDAWDDAVDAAGGGKTCPTCGKTVTVPPGEGTRTTPRDWHGDHDPKWKDRDLSGMTRQEVLDEFNSDVRLRCPTCNVRDNQ